MCERRACLPRNTVDAVNMELLGMWSVGNLLRLFFIFCSFNQKGPHRSYVLSELYSKK